ncbi:MAG: TIGR01841 family phasin, partial [Colwellia sp.]|nr:TIGR01841 family phasin [Colwellia sp.]
PAALTVLTPKLYRSILTFNQLLHRSILKGSFIMFTKISEQYTTAIKPFNSIIEINTKYIEQFINLQKTFLTAISWEVAAQTKTLSTQTDLAEAINDQKYYTDQLQTKVSDSAKSAFEVATKSSEEVVNLVKDSISEATNFTE